MHQLLAHLATILNRRPNQRVAQSVRTRDLIARGYGRRLAEASRRGGGTFQANNKTIVVLTTTTLPNPTSHP